MNWYLKVMKESYSDFHGRARRKEFWMWYLFYVIVLIVAMILDGVLGTCFEIGYVVTTPYGRMDIYNSCISTCNSRACC